MGNGSEELKRKMLKSGFWASFTLAITKIFQVAASITIARLLSPIDYGMNGVIWAIIMIMERFSQMGMQLAIVQSQEYDDNFEQVLDTLFTSNFVRGIVLTFFMYFSSSWVALFYEQPELENLMKVISLYFFIRGYANVGLTINIKNVNFKRIEIWEQISSSFSFIITIYLAYVYRNVWALVYGSVIGAVLYSITTYFIKPYRPKFTFSKKIFFDLFSFGKYFFVIQILIIISSKFDTMVIGKVVGLTVLGLYVLPYRLICQNLLQITNVIYKVSFSAIASIQNNVTVVKQIFIRSLNYFLSIIFPFLIFLFVFAEDIIFIVYGEKWMPIIPILKVMIFVGLFKSVENIFKSLFEATGKIKILFKIHLTCTALFIVSVYPITKAFSAIGTAYLVLSITILFHVISWPVFFLIFNFSIKEIINELFLPLVSAFFLAGFLIILYTYPLFTFSKILFNLLANLFLSMWFYIVVYYGLYRAKAFLVNE